MTNREAYKRALNALIAANNDQLDAYVESGGGWGSMDSGEIFSHIQKFIEHEFLKTPKPAPMFDNEGDE